MKQVKTYTRLGVLLPLLTLQAALGSRAWKSKSNQPIVDGITFAEQPGVMYAPLRETAQYLGIVLQWDAVKHTFRLNRRDIHPSSLKTTFDGTHLIPVKSFIALGARAQWQPDHNAALLDYGARQVTIRAGRKRVQVDRPTQTLKAWQGNRLVLKSQISTGREFGSTPAGIYHAGPVKEKQHHSRIAKGAYMPWSVQVKGDVFIHGFKNVPGRPVSRGCIRLPLDHGNPARWFYNWIDLGTPIQINGPHMAGKSSRMANRQ